MREKSLLKTNGIILLLFVLVSSFFILNIKDHTYLGIRVKKNDDEWVIKKVQPGGAASSMSLKSGDTITSIENRKPDANMTLTKWLIVESVSEMQIVRNGKKHEVTFSNENNVLNKQLLFTGIGLICLSILFLLPTFSGVTKTYRLFSLFVTSLSFSLVSVVPSSMGIDFARVIIVSVVSMFPLFFLKFSDFGKGYLRKVKKISVVISFISIINFICLFSIMLGFGSYFISEYLAIGIFYVFGLLLIVLVISDLVLKTDLSENITLSQVNLPLITILSFVPLFFFYLFPTRNNAPFHLVILFIFLPLAAITHLLFINRLIKSKRKMKPIILSLFIAISAGIIICLLVELGKYISTIYLALFTAMLVFAILPLLTESLSLINRKKTGAEGIQLFVAVEEERENISLYIHDTIIQEIIFEMSRFEQKENIVTEEVKQVFEEIIYGLRELCTEIYPLMIQEVGIENTLKTTINSIQRKYPVIIDLSIDPRIETISLKVKNFILRTVRETITNSIKHGKATEIEISIVLSNEKYILTVYDNGTLGAQLDNSDNHFGIHLINEKIKMIDGSVSLTKEFDKTKFQLKLPMSFDGKNEVRTQ